MAWFPGASSRPSWSRWCSGRHPRGHSRGGGARCSGHDDRGPAGAELGRRARRRHPPRGRRRRGRGAAAAAGQRENRDVERTRVAAEAVTAATRRAADLGDQSSAIAKKSDEIKKARAKAAAAEKKRRAAIKAQGYEVGVTDPREIAQQILDNKFDYGSDQFSCFDWIIKHESNWNVHAQNASSGAYGLPQSLPGSKMASVASDWRDNPATQIIWGVQYMKSRYGSPCGAKSHWESAGNY